MSSILLQFQNNTKSSKRKLNACYFCRVNWDTIKTYVALTLVSLFYGVNYSVLKVVVPEYVGPYGFIVC